MKANTEPTPSVELIVTPPPRTFAIRFVIARPSPVPVGLRREDAGVSNLLKKLKS